MRTGNRLGIDVGKARIGVARSDMHGMLATPVETITRDHSGISDIARLVEIIRELNVFECVFGLPVNMRGERTPSTDDAESFARRVAEALVSDTSNSTAQITEQSVGVRLIDERLSTVSAQGHLRQAGKKTKQTRSIIDQAAAVVILQHALDSERAQGKAPGVEVVVADLEPELLDKIEGDDDVTTAR